MTILSKIHVDYKHLFKGNPVLPSSGQHSSDYKLYMKTTFVSVHSCLLIKMQTKKVIVKLPLISNCGTGEGGGGGIVNW